MRISRGPVLPQYPKPRRLPRASMPVILELEDWTAWLEGPNPGALLKPAADDVLRLWPVSRG